MSRTKYLSAAPKSISGGDSSRQFAISGGGGGTAPVSNWFSATDAYHKMYSIPAGWKQVKMEVQGRVLSETNNAEPQIELEGSYASLKDVLLYGGFWGFSHNNYQYAEKSYWETHNLSNKWITCSYSAAGHLFGSMTNYYWKILLTAFPAKNYVVFHSEVNGNRRPDSSSYQMHYITQAAFSLTPSVLTGLDISFHGQAIDMAGTIEAIT